MQGSRKRYVERYERLVRLFERGMLPWAEWSQRTQLVIGLFYVHRLGFEAGLQRMRGRLQIYSQIVGIEQDYHETTIVFYMWTLAQFAERHMFVRNFAVLVERMFRDPVMEPGFLLRHYTPEKLQREDAARRWLEPDRLLLPEAERRRIRAATAALRH
ncbi:MAG: hypothetical protein AAGD14_19005 [Planctomycetota bacterium]